MEPKLTFVPVNRAFSVTNGIYFCLNNSHLFSVFSGIMPDTGDIVISTQLLPRESNRFRISKLERLLLLIFYVINLPLSFLLNKHVYSAFCILYMASISLMMIGYTLHESYQIKYGHNYSIGQYHSAEHMVINCYNSLKRVPENIDEIKQFSNFSSSCGSLVLFHRILVDIILTCAMIAIPFIKQTPSAVVFIAFVLILLVLVLISSCINPKAFEKLFLNEPEDKHLEVALRGLSEFVFLENLIASHDIHSNGKKQ